MVEMSLHPMDSGARVDGDDAAMHEGSGGELAGRDDGARLDGQAESSDSRIRTVKVKIRPATPTQEEILEHEVTHWPYRAWCRYCVAACGRRDAHPSCGAEGRDDGVATLAVDYCFFNDEQINSTEGSGAKGHKSHPDGSGAETDKFRRPTDSKMDSRSAGQVPRLPQSRQHYVGATATARRSWNA